MAKPRAAAPALGKAKPKSKTATSPQPQRAPGIEQMVDRGDFSAARAAIEKLPAAERKKWETRVSLEEEWVIIVTLRAAIRGAFTLLPDIGDASDELSSIEQNIRGLKQLEDAHEYASGKNVFWPEFTKRLEEIRAERAERARRIKELNNPNKKRPRRWNRDEDDDEDDVNIADVGMEAVEHKTINARIDQLRRRGDEIVKIEGLEGYEVHVIGSERNMFLDRESGQRAHAGGLSTLGTPGAVKRVWITRRIYEKDRVKAMTLIRHEAYELDLWWRLTENLMMAGKIRAPNNESDLPTIREWISQNISLASGYQREFHEEVNHRYSVEKRDGNKKLRVVRENSLHRNNREEQIRRLGHVVIIGRLSDSSTLKLGGIVVKFKGYGGRKYRLEVKDGLPVAVTFPENGKTRDFYRVIDIKSGKILSAHSGTIFRNKFSALNDVIVEARLSKTGSLNLGGGRPLVSGKRSKVGKDWAQFGRQYTKNKVRVYVKNGVVMRVWSYESDLDEDFTLIWNKREKRYVTSFLRGIPAEEMDQLTEDQEIHGWHLTGKGSFNFAARGAVTGFDGYGHRRIRVFNIHNPTARRAIPASISIVSFGVVRHLLMIYTTNSREMKSFKRGQLIDAVYRMDKKIARTIAEVNGDTYVIHGLQLNNYGGLYSIRYVTTFGHYPEAQVELKVVKGEPRFVRFIRDKEGWAIKDARGRDVIIDLEENPRLQMENVIYERIVVLAKDIERSITTIGINEVSSEAEGIAKAIDHLEAMELWWKRRAPFRRYKKLREELRNAINEYEEIALSNSQSKPRAGQIKKQRSVRNTVVVRMPVFTVIFAAALTKYMVMLGTARTALSAHSAHGSISLFLIAGILAMVMMAASTRTGRALWEALEGGEKGDISVSNRGFIGIYRSSERAAREVNQSIDNAIKEKRASIVRGKDGFERVAMIFKDGTEVEFVMKKAGNRWVWIFSNQHIEAVAKEFGFDLQENLVETDRFTSKYISVSITETGGIVGVFINYKNAYEKIKGDLDKNKEDGNRIFRKAGDYTIEFIRIKRKRWYVWAFRKNDAKYVASYYGLSLNEQLPRISSLFQLAVTAYGLRGYIESVQKAVRKIRNDLNVSNDGNRAIRRAGDYEIVFRKVSIQGAKDGFVWAMSIADLDAVIEYYGLKHHKDAEKSVDQFYQRIADESPSRRFGHPRPVEEVQLRGSLLFKKEIDGEQFGWIELGKPGKNFKNMVYSAFGEALIMRSIKQGIDIRDGGAYYLAFRQGMRHNGGATPDITIEPIALIYMDTRGEGTVLYSVIHNEYFADYIEPTAITLVDELRKNVAFNPSPKPLPDEARQYNIGHQQILAEINLDTTRIGDDLRLILQGVDVSYENGNKQIDVDYIRQALEREHSRRKNASAKRNNGARTPLLAAVLRSNRINLKHQAWVEQVLFWTINLALMSVWPLRVASAVTWSLFILSHFIKTKNMPNAPPLSVIIVTAFVNALPLAVFSHAYALFASFILTTAFHHWINKESRVKFSGEYPLGMAALWRRVIRKLQRRGWAARKIAVVIGAIEELIMTGAVVLLFPIVRNWENMTMPGLSWGDRRFETLGALIIAAYMLAFSAVMVSMFMHAWTYVIERIAPGVRVINLAPESDTIRNGMILSAVFTIIRVVSVAALVVFAHAPVIGSIVALVLAVTLHMFYNGRVAYRSRLPLAVPFGGRNNSDEKSVPQKSDVPLKKPIRIMISNISRGAVTWIFRNFILTIYDLSRRLALSARAWINGMFRYIPVLFNWKSGNGVHVKNKRARDSGMGLISQILSWLKHMFGWLFHLFSPLTMILSVSAVAISFWLGVWAAALMVPMTVYIPMAVAGIIIVIVISHHSSAHHNTAKDKNPAAIEQLEKIEPVSEQPEPAVQATEIYGALLIASSRPLTPEEKAAWEAGKKKQNETPGALWITSSRPLTPGEEGVWRAGKEKTITSKMREIVEQQETLLKKNLEKLDQASLAADERKRVLEAGRKTALELIYIAVYAGNDEYARMALKVLTRISTNAHFEVILSGAMSGLRGYASSEQPHYQRLQEWAFQELNGLTWVHGLLAKNRPETP